jgi:hypothetical protein
VDAVTGGTGNSGIASNAGTGGAGRTSTGVGNAGVNYGGGGGGSWRTTANRNGSNGGAGYARIDYIPACSLMLMGCG